MKKALFIFLLFPFIINAQELDLTCNIPTVSNFQVKNINNQLYFSFHQLSDTIPGFYVLVKSNGTDKKVVHTQEIVNTPLKRTILVCMQDVYEPKYNSYILKKINTPKDFLPYKETLRLISIADSLYFIKVTKD
jgi:hypothetical protein